MGDRRPPTDRRRRWPPNRAFDHRGAGLVAAGVEEHEAGFGAEADDVGEGLDDGEVRGSAGLLR